MSITFMQVNNKKRQGKRATKKKRKKHEIKLQWKTKKQEKNHKSITMVLHVPTCMYERKENKAKKYCFFI